MSSAPLQRSGSDRLRQLARACLLAGVLLVIGSLWNFPDPLHLSLGFAGALLTLVLGWQLLTQIDRTRREQTQALALSARSEEVLQARLRLMAEASRTTLHDFLVLTLDEVERFTASKVSFYHFVDPDQQSIHLQAWSTQTAKVYCHADGMGHHYSLAKAGVWADCVRERKAIIHNDYAHMAGKKGLPEGHAALVRELVVPIFREETIVAILGVGNKETDYDQHDVKMVSLFADLAWGLAERKMAEEELDSYRKRLEEMVAERELKYSVLFDSGNDAVFVTELDGDIPTRFVEVNAVACTNLGFSRDELLGILPSRIGAWEDSNEFHLALRRLRDEGRCIFETALRTREGETVPVEVSSRLLQWQGKSWMISIARDISDRRTAEAELRNAIARAESATRVKSEFLANMSHEIRTPLNAVIGFSELLAGTECRPEQVGYIASIRTSSRNLLRLINDILDMSKMEAGRLRIAASPTDLRHLLQEMVRMFGAQVSQKRIGLSLRIQDDLPASVSVDEIRLRQILLNLVGNAIKFTHQGEVLVQASSRPSAKSSDRIDLELKVADSGIGIATEEQELVFEAFEQSHGADSRRSGGTGLGLAISRKLARLMGGEIHLDSVEGKGSTFTVVLPDLAVVDTAGEPVAPPEDFSTVHYREGRVLVVDDLEINRTLMREILDLVGLECLEAENGQVAVQVAREAIPDLILMDIRMPVMDGLEATGHLRRGLDTRQIPIVALTASVDRTNSPELVRVGFDGFLGKPIEVPSLVRTLDRWFSRVARDTSASVPEAAERSIDRRERETIAPLLKDFREHSASGLNFNEVRKLSERIAESARELESPALVELADGLEGAAKAFDVRTIESILKSLEEAT